jgi:hypothetical protein
MAKAKSVSLNDPQIWSNVGEPTAMVVYKEGVFYADTVDPAKHAEIVKQIAEGADPAPLLGKKCQKAALADIRRVVADSASKFVIETDDPKPPVKIGMAKEGIKILEAIQDELGSKWVSTVGRRVQIGASLIALVVGALIGGGLVWAYFGVVSGEVRRIHWLAALLINTFGPSSLLVLAAIFFLGGIIVFGVLLASPAEVWTLEED